MSNSVTPEILPDQHACGPDSADHVAVIQFYVDAGFDGVFIGEMGPDQQRMVDYYT